MKLIVMTQPTFFVEEDKILTALFDAGLDCLHLYKPNSAPIYSERLLLLLPEDYRKKVVVHEHFYLKGEYNLAGIHLDGLQESIPQGYKGKVTYTCHDLPRLKETKKRSDRYVFLANTFGNDEDMDAGLSYSSDMLRSAAMDGLIDKKVYAWGGVTTDTIARAKDLHFGGVVLERDLWNKFDIHNQQDYKELILYFEKVRKLVS